MVSVQRRRACADKWKASCARFALNRRHDARIVVRGHQRFVRNWNEAERLDSACEGALAVPRRDVHRRPSGRVEERDRVAQRERRALARRGLNKRNEE